MKYKIIKHRDDDYSLVYSLCKYEDIENGETILVFEADSYDHANFIKNQFLNFEPYKPFGDCWLVKVSHLVSINNKNVANEPYEIRTLIVVAETESEARRKVEKEAKNYSEPYKNVNQENVKWEFDKILSIKEIDFFSTIDLYKGIPVEINSERTDINPN